MTDDTRGERNNNPGNLNWIDPAHGRPFLGQARCELLHDGGLGRFAVYDTAFHGLRALAEQLLIDEVRRGFHTPIALIQSWAPSVDGNDVMAYARDLAAMMRVNVLATVDLTNLDMLASATWAIVTHENGRCIYAPELIRDACASAIAAIGGSKADV